jgi:D-glycero-D-manno-heptose 1,7-bisphosphate phosphatase
MMRAMGRKAILLDRDGTLCEEVGYVNHVARVRIPERSIEAVRRANEAGLQTVVVTNQAGVARGYFTEALVGDVHDHVREALRERGARLDGIYYCPHHPEIGSGSYRRECDCRKPRPGMLLRARDEMGIDLASSYMVGDSHKDVEAGRSVGATTVLVLTGYGRGELEHQSPAWKVRPDHVAADLLEAVEWILERERGASRKRASEVAG